MSVVSVENLSKFYPVAVKSPGIKGTLTHFFKRTYREVKAVQDISFSIETGEVVGFLGPNGAGKTTTLKMLTGLIHPSQGQVRVAGLCSLSSSTPIFTKSQSRHGSKTTITLGSSCPRFPEN